MSEAFVFSDATATAQGDDDGAIAAIVGTEGKYHGKTIDDQNKCETMTEHFRREFTLTLSKTRRRQNGVKKI